MPSYEDIHIINPKVSGLEVCNPDGSVFNRIYVHYSAETCSSYFTHSEWWPYEKKQKISKRE